MSDKNYKWNAADYAAHSSAQLTWARELYTKLGLNGNERILDIGCGDGKITAELAARVPDGHVTGVDNSRDMIELAKKNHPQSQHPNLEFQVMDARQIDFTDRFDVVFSNAALHWVRDHGPVLQGISGALRSGGSFLLQMGGAGNAGDLVRIIDQLIADDPWKDYFQQFEFPYGFHSPETYRTWLDSAGLLADRNELIMKDMVYDTREKLTGWFRTTWLPYLERVPSKMQENFIKTVIDQYLQEYKTDPNGNIHLQMVRLEVQGAKTT